jgi:hypothetical protein
MSPSSPVEMVIVKAGETERAGPFADPARVRLRE